MGRSASASSGANTKPRGKKGPKKAPARRVIQGSEYLQELIEAYLMPEETENYTAMQVHSGEAMAEGSKIHIAGSGSSSSSSGVEIDCCKNHKVGKNQSDQCKRKKRGIDCVHGFCFQCCLDTPVEPNSNYSYCAGHYPQKAKKELEDRFIEEGLNRKLRDRSKFFSYEERFTDTQQTVTIWCSSDFYAYKSYSADVMADVAKAERRIEATKKRRLHSGMGMGMGGGAAVQAVSVSASSSQPPPSTATATATGADGRLVSNMAKAWCVVREQTARDNQARWEHQQKLWLEEQERLGVQSTAWILDDEHVGAVAARRNPKTAKRAMQTNDSIRANRDGSSTSTSTNSRAVSPKRSRQ